ncbi:MAG: sigma-70 family RNA polymerase sigma factor [Myxococcales bacterium]|nr:sigma-70 family RNA polymerase sigma factor [Myxococcales bacterium]
MSGAHRDDPERGPGDRATVERLLAGDREAFAALVDKHNDTMLRVARAMLPSRGVAEEVVQETWLAILKGLSRFEGRSSLKTWMFRILTNRARTRARREGRTTPMSAMGKEEEPLDADRFDTRGMWRNPPDAWDGTPEKLAVDKEIGSQIEAAIETLPERQRMVLVLRDVKGWSSPEVCNVMEISETNQRVLLHRARAKVRSVLARYLEGRS